MKRLIGIILAAAMLMALAVSFTACGEKVKEPYNSGSGQVDTKPGGSGSGGSGGNGGGGGNNGWDDDFTFDEIDFYKPENTHTGIEYSTLWGEPVIVTYDEFGNRMLEKYRDGVVEYFYDHDRVLLGLIYNVFGWHYELHCSYDENGRPVRAEVAGDEDDKVIFFLFECDEQSGKILSMTHGSYDGDEREEVLGETYRYNEYGVTQRIDNPNETCFVLEYSGANIYSVRYEISGELYTVLEYKYTNDGKIAYIGDYSVPNATTLVLDREKIFTYNDEGCLYEHYDYVYSEHKERLLLDRIQYSSFWEELTYEINIYRMGPELVQREIRTADSFILEEYLTDDDGKSYLSERTTETLDAHGYPIASQEEIYSSRGYIMAKNLRFVDTDGWEINEYYETMTAGGELVLIGKDRYMYDTDTDSTIFEYYSYDDATGKLYLSRVIVGKDGEETVTEYDPDGNII
ncbi:MAG: hypothetical protein E7616_10145 [Ruminococcaceae bacterium]|nr:hypothetical protein [Oscillospiraceae bacterium]